MIRWERPNGERSVLRPECHVNYQDDEYVPGQYLYAPAQLLAFVEDEGIFYAIGISCKFCHSLSSVFSTRWEKEYVWKPIGGQQLHAIFIETKSIVRSCLMIPETNDDTIYHEIWPPELWADQFCSH